MKHFACSLLIGLIALGTELNAQNHLLILNKSGDTAWHLDAVTGEKIAEYPTGSSPHEVAVSPDKKWAVVTNYGDNLAGNSLTVVNLKERKVEKTIELDRYRKPHGIEWFSDNRRVAVSAEEQQSVLIVDVLEGEILSAIQTGERISHMVELGQKEEYLYVTNIGSGSLTVIDLSEETVVKTLSPEEGEGTEGITLANKGKEIWITNRVKNTVTIIDTRSLEIIDTLQSPSFPIRAEVSPDGRFVAVSNARSSTVTIFEVKSREQVEVVSTQTPGIDNGIPIGLTFSNDGNRLFVANSNANQIVVIDTTTWKVMETFATGPTPDGIAFITAD